MSTPILPRDVDADHPWLGLIPFTEATQGFFFGRDQEIRDIFVRVREQPLTILFGQSGLGKTSLLGAGLIPKLTVERFRPALLRLEYGLSDPPLLEQVRQALARTLPPAPVDASDGQKAGAPGTLWELFHHQTAFLAELAASPLVLIFDQFEEIFTLAESHTRQTEARELFEQLADLVENRPPGTVQERLLAERRLAREYDLGPAPLRVVITLREDFLSHLEAWKKLMPSLMRNRMPQRLLNGPQALEAVVRPGQLGGRELVTHEVGQRIVCFVARRPAGTPLDEIAAVPPLLSLLCDELNSARVRAGAAEITAAQVNEQSDNILQNFYSRSFDDLPAAVQRIVEDRLVSVGGHRNSVAREDIVAELARDGVTDPASVIDKLVQRRLLSAEERGGLQRLEITHDVLAPLVVHSRDQRRAKQAEAHRNEQSARRLRRLKVITAATAVAAVVIGGLGLLSLTQWRLAVDQADELGRLKQRAETDAKKAIELKDIAERHAAEAKQQKDAALRNAAEALRQQGLAEEEEQHAKKETDRANRNEQVALQNLYPARIREAQSLWQADEVPTAWNRLTGVVEQYQDRGWEWHYLAGLCRSRLTVVPSHKAAIEHLAFHPRGGSFFSSDYDGNVVEWDAARGTVLRSIPALGRKQVGLGFGLRWHGGKLLVVKTNPYKPIEADEKLPRAGDEILALSDQEGRMVPVVDLDEVRIKAMVLGLAGSQLALEIQPLEAGPPTHLTVTRKEVDSIGHSGRLASMAVSPDGTMLATSGEDKSLQIWLLDGCFFPTMFLGASLVDFEVPVRSIAFSPDSRQFAVGIQNNVAIGVLAQEPGQKMRADYVGTSSERHTQPVVQVLFTPNHPWLLSASKDGTVKVWDLDEKALRRTLRVISPEKLKAQETFPKIATDGERLAVVFDMTLKCWDLNDGKPIDTFAANTFASSIAFQPHDALLAATTFDGTIRLLDRAGKEVRKLPMVDGPAGDVAFSPDGQLVAVCGWDRSVTLRSLAERSFEERALPGSAINVVFTPDERWLITVGRDKTIRMRDGASGRLLRRIPNLAAFFCLRPDGTRVLSARGADVVSVDLATGDETVCFRVPTGKVAALAICPANGRIAAANDDREAPRVVVYDDLERRTVCELTPSGQSNSAWLAFSHDGKFLAHRSKFNGVDVWNLERQERTALPEDRVPICGAFQPMTGELAIGYRDGAVILWSIRDSGDKLELQQQRRLAAHRAFVMDIDFTSDGRRMATSGYDGMLRCWDCETGEELLSLRHETDISDNCVAFGGRVKSWRLVSGSSKQVKMWDAAVLAADFVPQDPAAFILRGCVHTDFAMWNDAADDFSAAIRLGSDDPYVWQYRGMALAGAGRFKEAEGDFAEAAQRLPNDPSVRLARHLAFAAAGNFERAEEEYAEVVKRIGSAIAFPGDQRRTTRETEWQAAEFFGWDRVIDGLTRKIERGKAPWYAYRARAAAFMDLGRSTAATADFLEAEKLKGDDWQTLRGLARAHLARSAKAGESVRASYEQARDASSLAIKLDPNPWEQWYLRAIARRNLDEFDLAIDDCSQAIKRNPDAWKLWDERGLLRAQRGQFESAAADFQQAIQRGSGGDYFVWGYLVHAQRASGNDVAYHQACLAMFRRLGPNEDVNSANSVAWAWAIGPHPEPVPPTVVDHLRLAVKSKPDSWSWANTLGCILYRAGNDREALEWLNKSVELQGSGRYEDFFFLALAEQRLGHAEAAAGWHKKGLQWLASAADGAATGNPAATNREKLTWDERVECQVLQAEIERLLKIPPAQPE